MVSDPLSQGFSTPALEEFSSDTLEQVQANQGLQVTGKLPGLKGQS